MLPPGHIAGAYLTTSAMLILINPAVTPDQLVVLLWIGIFFGFAPDLDFFYGFITRKTLTPSEGSFDHRAFLSHAPLLWLIAGILTAFIAQDPFWKVVGLLIWMGSWTHFILDSIEGGIMWLWPINKKHYALVSGERKFITREKRFWPFWIEFTKWYAVTFLSFKLEIAVILLAGWYWIMG